MTDMDDLAQILREGNAAEERRYEAEKRHREDIMDKIAEDSENRQRQREMDRIQRQMANDETNRNLGEIKGYMAGVSNRIDVMREDLLQGMKGLAITVAQSAAAICAKLDALYDLTNNPLRTKADELLRFAFKAYNADQYKEALKYLDKAIHERMNDAPSWFLMGRIYLEGRYEDKKLHKVVDVRDIDKAIESFTEAVEYSEKVVEYSKNRTDNSAACLQAGQAWSYRGIAYVSKYWESKDLQDAALARESFENALEYFPEPPQIQEAPQDENPLFRFESPKEREEREERKVQQKQNLELKFWLARCNVLLGDFPKAVDTVKEIILKDPEYYKKEVEADPYMTPIRRKKEGKNA